MRLIEAKHYPNFDFVLRKNVPHFSQSPKVMKEFRWWSGLDKEQSTNALLRFDTPPEIQVERIATGHPIGEAGWKSGLHSTRRVGDIVRSHISINRGIILLLEGIPMEMLKGETGRSAKLAKAGRDLADYVASLVMHEIVHHGTTLVKQPEQLEKGGKIEDVDFGSGFQQAAGLNYPFPRYFLEVHSIQDSPMMMRRGDPPDSEFEEEA